MKLLLRIRLLLFVTLWPVLTAMTPLSLPPQTDTNTLAAQSGNIMVISNEGNHEYSPAIAYNSIHDEYLVVWSDAWDDLHGRRVKPNGQVLNRFVVSSSPNGKTMPSVAYDPGRDRYLVTWAYDLYGNASDYNIFGRFIPWDGPSATLLDFSICDWTSNQWRPAVAFARTQDEFLVVWMDFPVGIPRQISGRRISADGSGFPVSGFLISSGTENRDWPDVAYNLARNEYVVIWGFVGTGGKDIGGVRLSGAGVPLGGGEFVIAGWPSWEGHPSIAACSKADQYLVGWQSDKDTGGTDYAIYARFLDGGGVPGNVHLIDDTTAFETEVDLECDAGGHQYFLAWQTMYATSFYGVSGRIVNPDESMEDAFVIEQPGSSHNRFHAAVGGGRATFMTAWEHEAGISSSTDILGRPIFPDQIPLGFFPITPCRVLDTRLDSGPQAGAPVLAAQSLRTFSLVDKCGLPAGARAISVNLTVVNGTAIGDLQVIGGHLTSTTTSAVSIPLSRARANNATVQLSNKGTQTISVINTTTGEVHFIVDINGYFQ